MIGNKNRITQCKILQHKVPHVAVRDGEYMAANYPGNKQNVNALTCKSKVII